MKGGERLTLECLEQGMRLETEALADLPHLLNMNALDYVDLPAYLSPDLTVGFIT